MSVVFSGSSHPFPPKSERSSPSKNFSFQILLNCNMYLKSKILYRFAGSLYFAEIRFEVRTRNTTSELLTNDTAKIHDNLIKISSL